MESKTILNSYDNKKELYQRFESSMSSLIDVLLSNAKINTHSINSRVKDRASLKKKVEAKSKYRDISDITDVVGLRIITHYSDEVDDIAAIIEKEFKVDRDHTIDKRKSLEPDRFGYLSLHYVVELSDKRSALNEYSSFKGLKFEIQIRSILQHTWAEIEHDIGYKSPTEVPKHIRRKFSQLAGVLELADEQFLQLKQKLNEYELEVESNINNKPDEISIDNISIINFIKNDNLVKQLDQQIANILKVTITNTSQEILSTHIKYANYFNIGTIGILKKYLTENADYVIKRAEDILDMNVLDSKTLTEGISVLYMYQILAAKLGSIKKIKSFLSETSLGFQDERDEFAEYLFQFCKEEKIEDLKN